MREGEIKAAIMHNNNVKKKTVSTRVHWRLCLLGWMGWEHVPVKRCITRSPNIIASSHDTAKRVKRCRVLYICSARSSCEYYYDDDMSKRAMNVWKHGLGCPPNRHTQRESNVMSCMPWHTSVSVFVTQLCFASLIPCETCVFQLIFSWWWCWAASTDAIIENEPKFAPPNMTALLQLWARKIMSYLVPNKHSILYCFSWRAD